MPDLISVYDPGVDAYREVSVENAVKMVKAAKETEAKLLEMGVSLEDPEPEPQPEN